MTFSAPSTTSQRLFCFGVTSLWCPSCSQQAMSVQHRKPQLRILQELLDVVWGDDAPAFELLQREVCGAKAGGWCEPHRSSRLEGFEGYGGKMGQWKFSKIFSPKKIGTWFFVEFLESLKMNIIRYIWDYDYERKEWQWCKPYCQVKVRYFTKAMISPEGGLVIWAWWLEMLGNISPRAHI